MHIDPANSAPVQTPIANECDHLAVRDGARLVHPLISSQKLCSTSTIANQEFSIHQFLPGHFIKTQEPVQLEGKRSEVG